MSQSAPVISRVSIVSMSILRYLMVKNEPTTLAQIHLEISFCVVSENWDFNDQSLRQILQTMTRNGLIESTQMDKEVLYSVARAGYEIAHEFTAIDQNILEQAWKIRR